MAFVDDVSVGENWQRAPSQIARASSVTVGVAVLASALAMGARVDTDAPRMERGYLVDGDGTAPRPLPAATAPPVRPTIDDDFAPASTATTTITKTFAFVADAEGLVETGLSATLGFAWQAADSASGTGGSIKFTTASTTAAQEERAEQNSKTWADWGVPAGATVTQIALTHWSSKLAAGSTPTPTVSIYVEDNTGTRIYTGLDPVDNTSASATASWVDNGAGNGGTITIQAASQAQTSFANLAVDVTMSPTAAPVDFRIDEITFSVTYTTAGAPSMLDELGAAPTPAPTASSSPPRVFADTDELPAPPTATVIVEDFWIPPPPPAPAVRIAIAADAEDVPALFGQPDEDFWTARPAPQPVVLWQRLPFVDDDVPAGALFGQPDEDFWSTYPPPAAVTMRAPVALDPDETPAGALFGAIDEDTWTLRPLNAVAPIARAVLDTDDIATAPIATIVDDGDTWTAAPPPAAVLQRAAVAVDVDDVPPLAGQPDEDFWNSGVAPAAVVHRVSMPLGEPDAFAGLVVSAGFVYEDDSWLVWRPPSPPALPLLPIGCDDVRGPPLGQAVPYVEFEVELDWTKWHGTERLARRKRR
jgi:hypothetical protein